MILTKSGRKEEGGGGKRRRKGKERREGRKKKRDDKRRRKGKETREGREEEERGDRKRRTRHQTSQTHHIRILGGEGGQDGAGGGVLLHRDVGVRARERGRVVVEISELDGDPGGVRVARVLPAPAPLGERETPVCTLSCVL